MRFGSTALAAFLLSAFAGTGIANACTPPPGWPQKAELSPKVVADVIVSHAAQIDLVVADHFTHDAEVAPLPKVWGENASPAELSEWAQNWRETWSDAVRIHYRVVATLVGGQAAKLEISGEKLTAPLPTDQNVERRLKSFLNQKDLSEWPNPGACVTPVFAAVGQQYLVARDSKGKLLEVEIPLRFRGEQGAAHAPAVVPVSGAEDPWLKLVEQAISRAP